MYTDQNSRKFLRMPSTIEEAIRVYGMEYVLDSVKNRLQLTEEDRMSAERMDRYAITNDLHQRSVKDPVEVPPDFVQAAGSNWDGYYPYTLIGYRFGKRIYRETPTLDSALEIRHEDDWTVHYIMTPSGRVYERSDFDRLVREAQGPHTSDA